MTKRKVGIIGVGRVGSHVAFSLATQGEADELVLIDTNVVKAHAHGLDIADSVSYFAHEVNVYQGDYADLTDADAVVICVGPPSGPKDDRLDELEEMVEVLKTVLPQLKASKFAGVIINISNPADVVATYIQAYLDYPTHKILSTGCVLDSARLQSQLAQLLTISRQSIQAYCLGEHGFSAMIPWSHVSLAGQPLAHHLAERQELAFEPTELLQQTKVGGYQVLKGKGATEFGIATALVEVIKRLFHDDKKILPVSVYLAGQYGETGIFASVPTVIGRNGVEQIIEWDLPAEELAAFASSCQVIRENYQLAAKF